MNRFEKLLVDRRRRLWFLVLAYQIAVGDVAIGFSNYVTDTTVISATLSLGFELRPTEKGIVKSLIDIIPVPLKLMDDCISASIFHHPFELR